jgi:hypothetical protein
VCVCASQLQLIKMAQTDQSFLGRCEYLKVRSTGVEALDRVRESLSFNDIKVSQNKDLWGKQDTSKVNSFNNKVYHIIVGETLDILSPTCPYATTRFVPQQLCLFYVVVSVIYSHSSDKFPFAAASTAGASMSLIHRSPRRLTRHSSSMAMTRMVA